MPTARPTSRSKPSKPDAASGRPQWIRAGRDLLIAKGIGAVKIENLATRLGVTREAFYWHFQNLKDLQNELLKDWENVNSIAYRGLLDTERRDDDPEYGGVGKLWIKENYAPKWDIAVRDWARQSATVAKTVKQVDRMRLGIIEQVFRDMGYNESEAMIRARVTYFNQVGAQRVGLQDADEKRAKLEREYFFFLILGQRPAKRRAAAARNATSSPARPRRAGPSK